MSDEMYPLDAKRTQRTLNGIGQTIRVASTDVFGGAAVTRQVQSDVAPPCGQSGLGKHPSIEIGAKAMHEQHWHTAPLAELEVTQTPAGDFDVARLRPFDFRVLSV